MNIRVPRQSLYLIRLIRVIVLCLSLMPCISWAGETRKITDSRKIMVEVPARINRVVTISDGLVEGVMTFLGKAHTIVGVGSEALQKTWDYSFDSINNSSFSYKEGMNPVTYLNPWIKDVPLVAADSIINYETLARLDPDVVIIRLGSCNLWVDDEKTGMTLETLSALGIPVVVLYAPHFHKKAESSTIYEEINIIGDIFNCRSEVRKLIDFMESQIHLITERTKNIEQKTRVLIFGPSSNGKNGGVGVVFGKDTIESFFIEALVNGSNAFQDNGYFKMISQEHLLAINPDVIVLCTAGGYHPARELYESFAFQNIQEVSAIKNRRIFSLPWTPWNCAKRLEYPIDVMVIAKAAYPERFSDIDLGKWLLDYYKKIYSVDDETAVALRSCQWMDWTVEQ